MLSRRFVLGSLSATGNPAIGFGSCPADQNIKPSHSDGAVVTRNTLSSNAGSSRFVTEEISVCTSDSKTALVVHSHSDLI